MERAFSSPPPRRIIPVQVWLTSLGTSRRGYLQTVFSPLRLRNTLVCHQQAVYFTTQFARLCISLLATRTTVAHGWRVPFHISLCIKYTMSPLVAQSLSGIPSLCWGCRSASPQTRVPTPNTSGLPSCFGAGLLPVELINSNPRSYYSREEFAYLRCRDAGNGCQRRN